MREPAALGTAAVTTDDCNADDDHSRTRNQQGDAATTAASVGVQRVVSIIDAGEPRRFSLYRFARPRQARLRNRLARHAIERDAELFDQRAADARDVEVSFTDMAIE